MYYSGINDIDSVNGIGVGVALYVSGCTHHCKGCFNPETWSFTNGDEFTDDTLNYLCDLVNRSYIDYFSVLGGEPFEPQNVNTVYKIIRHIKSINPSLVIYIWSGYLYEDLIKRSDCIKLLSLCDYLIDGEFKIELRDLRLMLRGSSNQRVIDLKQSLSKNTCILYEI